MRPSFLLTLFSVALLTSCMRTPTSTEERTQPPEKVRLAFVNTPVVDVLGAAPTKGTKNYSESRYHHLPCSYLTAHHKAAPRIHQLLLNQIVKIRAEKAFESLIEIPAVQIGSNEKTTNIVGWVLKRHLTPVEVLNKKRHSDAAFADPLGLINKKKTTLLALIHPYYIPQAKQTLSAGTLFPIVKEHKNAFLTHIWDESNKQFCVLSLPKSVALAQVPMKRDEAVQRCVALLRFWANQKSGFIPYVLGGGSWTHNYTEKRFEKKGSGKSLEYHRKEAVDSMHSGFDCTTLIYNAARITGIPYFCRNTTAIKQLLREVRPGEPIETGDLLLFPGHVAIISSTKPLKFIQAQGYGLGYGRIIEGLSHHHFNKIQTLNDLKNHLKAKRPLTLLNISKKPCKMVKGWSIYRFKSCWERFEHNGEKKR